MTSAPPMPRRVPTLSLQVSRLPDILGFLVAAYVVLLPFQIEVRHQLRIAPSDLFLLLALFLAPHQARFRPRVWTFWHLGLVLTFACGCLLTSLESGGLNRYVVLNKGLGLLVLLLSYASITSVAGDWERIRRLLRWFVLSVCFQNAIFVVFFLASFLLGIALPGTSYGGRRLSGMLIDPNAYGGLLSLALTLSEGASLGGRPLFRGATQLFCRLTLGLGLLFSFSRSAWLSLAPVLLALVILRFRSALLTLGTMAASLGLAWLAAGGRFLEFARGMATRPERGSGRLELMANALAEFSRHPFLGGGIGSFLATEGTMVHNTPLWFLTDLGLMGLIVLVGLLLWYFTRGLAAYRLAPPTAKPLLTGLLLGHAAMTILSMGIEAFYQRHWWLVCALIASSYSIAVRNQPPADKLLRYRAATVKELSRCINQHPGLF